MLVGQTESGVSDFIAPFFDRVHKATIVPNALLNLAAGYRYPDYLYALSTAWSAPTLATAWLVAVVAASGTALYRDPDRRHGAVLVLSLVPLFLALATSLAFKPVLLLGRYEIIVLPMFTLVLARGLAWLLDPRSWGLRSLGMALLAAYMIFATLGLRDYFAAAPNRLSNVIAATISEHAMPGDRVIVTGLIRAPVQYYLQLAKTPVSVRSFPAAVGDHLGWYDPSAFSGTTTELSREAAALVRSQPITASVFLVDHSASPTIRRINSVLHDTLAAATTKPPIALYAAGPDPSAAPVFAVIRYEFD